MVDIQVDFLKWIREVKVTHEQEGSYIAFLKATRSAYNGLWFTFSSRYPIGTNVFSEEWDLLIILDGCRVDALREVAPEYDYLSDVGSILSVGSASHEWMANTFKYQYIREISNTALVTSNPFFDHVFEAGEMPPFGYSVPLSIPKWNVVSGEDLCYTEWVNRHVDPYWEEVGLDLNIKSAEYMTDRTIVAGRSVDCDRIIAHYFQPHRPFVHRAVETGELLDEDDHPYEFVRKGQLSKESLWERYLNNLRYVLDSVGTLLENVDAERVVISADHGELMGEWGQWGHPEGVPHPNLKRVPWAITTASDTRSYQPDQEIIYSKDHDSYANLEALGYV